jgi:hypothetical protein
MEHIIALKLQIERKIKIKYLKINERLLIWTQEGT